MDRFLKLLNNISALVVVVMLLATIFWFGSLVYWGFFAPDPVTVPSTAVHPRPKTHQILPGDTLWAIASKYYPGMHTGEMVHEIQMLNSLASATIYPYQIIDLPEVE